MGILGYSEPFHNCIPTHIQNPVNSVENTGIENPEIFRTLAYLKPDIYAEPSQRFKMEIVKSHNYFAKVLNLVPSASLGTRLLKCSIIDLWHGSEYALLSYILFN